MLDYLAIAALTAELRQRISGTRVQAVIPLDRLGLALELFGNGRWYLLLTADPQGSGISLQRERARRGGGRDSPLVLAARARLIGTRLQAIEQPSWERILWLTFDGDSPSRLILELMGRLANLLLLDADDRVLAVARPVTRAMSRARTVLPGRSYEAPPEPAKKPPSAVTAEEIAAWLAQEPDMPAWRVLCSRVRAVSPLLAREAVHRAVAGTADADAKPASTASLSQAGLLPAGRVAAVPLHRALATLLALPETGAWQPGISRSGEALMTYAPYRLHHLPHWQPTDSLVTAIALCEAERQRGDAYGLARKEVAEQLDEVRRRVLRRLANLEAQRPDLGAAEADRMKGDLILAYKGTIRPGQQQLTVPGLVGEAVLTIDLDPALSPLANAQRYYGRSRRSRRAAQALPALLESALLELAALEQLAVDLQLAEDRAHIDAVRLALQALAPVTGKKAQGQPRSVKPLRFTSGDGFTILVGRNSLENELVTFRLARRKDLWLHAQGVPGGHVVIQSGGREVPDSTLEMAASLAAYYSRARSERSVAVDATAVRNVHRVTGGAPGMVRYRSTATLRVRPAIPPTD